MARRTRRPNRISRIILVLAAVVASTAVWKIYEDVLSSNVNLEGGAVGYAYIPSGKSIGEIEADLVRQKILRNNKAFFRLIDLLSYETRLKAGRYRVNGSMGNLELMRLFASGKQEPLDVTFISAARKSDFAGFWSHQLEADSTHIMDLLGDPMFAKQFGLNTENVLTLFIPNTYNFYWNTHAEKLVMKLASAYADFWDSTRLEKAKKLGLQKWEVSVLASIVQKETAKRDEMPVIAGVYFNRLKKRIPLQADPTVIFALDTPGIHRVTGPMLQIASPYNTYRHAGLPPGPICVASVQAIDAVLNMKKHRYIYFCAKPDFSGYHTFAETFSQHMINARKWQRELNRRGIMR
jgi:UPF0755 protein